VCVEEPGKTNTPRTGALNTNPNDLTMRREPPHLGPKPSKISWERLDSEYPTIGINHSRDMDIGVGIHTTNNLP
jgi:hypothetical protein